MIKESKLFQVSPLTRKVSAYIAEARSTALPPGIVERAKLHLVDTVAAIMSGTRLLPGRRALAYVKPLGGPREAGVIGTKLVLPVLQAALANGM